MGKNAKELREQYIKHWTEVIPCVFYAENVFNTEHPEWLEKLNGLKDKPQDERQKVANEYVKLLATMIVDKTEDEELEEMENEKDGVC